MVRVSSRSTASGVRFLGTSGHAVTQAQLLQWLPPDLHARGLSLGVRPPAAGASTTQDSLQHRVQLPTSSLDPTASTAHDTTTWRYPLSKQQQQQQEYETPDFFFDDDRALRQRAMESQAARTPRGPGMEATVVHSPMSIKT